MGLLEKKPRYNHGRYCNYWRVSGTLVYGFALAIRVQTHSSGHYRELAGVGGTVSFRVHALLILSLLLIPAELICPFAIGQSLEPDCKYDQF